MERAQLKAMAKEQIKGNIGILFVIYLIIFGIYLVLSFIPVAGGVAALLIMPPLSLAVYAIYLNLTKGQKPEVSHLFSKFDQFVPALVANLLVGLFVFLWSLLLFIPGIIKSYSYYMTNFILADNPGISGKEALDRSKAMMHGHKMELFVLHLSFLGWMLLGMLTFGLLYIWLIPYMTATEANFYDSIKGAGEATPAVEAPSFAEAEAAAE